MFGKNAGRDDTGDLRVPSCVYSELGRVEDCVTIGVGIERPRDATCICLTSLPIDKDTPVEVETRSRNGEWYPGPRIRSPAQVVQHTPNSETEPLSQRPPGAGVSPGRRFRVRQHRVGGGGATTRQESYDGSADDGKWGLVGTIIVGRGNEGEESVRDAPGERKAENGPGDGAADGPEVHR